MIPRKILPILFLILVLFVLPVSAKIVAPTGGNIDIAHTLFNQNGNAFTFTADPDEKISIIEFDLPLNTVVNFTLYYGTGSTVSGWAIYRPVTVAALSYSEVALGSDSWHEDFWDAQAAGFSLTKHVQFTSYAKNTSEDPAVGGFAIYAQGYGLFSNEIAFFPVPNLPNNLIYRMDFTASQSISYSIETAKTEKLVTFVSQTPSEYSIGAIARIINDAVSYASFFWTIFTTIFYWMKFFFIDNGLMTFTLYIVITAAYTVNKSRDIFQFFKNYIRLQKTLILFVVEVFERLINIIAGWLPFK